MAIFKSLTFDGINSLDYGIYITGEAVYNAPERVVEMVSVPGRNGNIAIDQGRFENIEVTYPAGCFADSQADFANKVMRFRNALASRYTYKRLMDEYHSDEYRLGLYKSGLDVDAVRYGTAGQFDITFDCKPQRFLLSGETAVTPSDYGNPQTETGEIVTIDSDGSLGVKSLEVSLSPIQDLNGYDHPWVGGAGKNKLPSGYATTQTKNGVTFTINEDGTVKANGTATATTVLYLSTYGDLWSSGSYILNGCPSGGGNNKYCLRMYATGGTTLVSDFGSGVTFTGQSQLECAIVIWKNQTVSNVVFEPMIRLASETDATYEPYTNICPISGRTEVNTIVSSTTSATDGRTYTTALGRTVYGGTLDVVSGVLTVDKVTLEWLSSSNFGKGSATTVDEFFLRPIASEAGISGTYYDAEHIICSHAKNTASTSTETSVYTRLTSQQPRIIFPLSMGMTLANFKTWLDEQQTNGTPLQVCYMLATPQTYQLTPQQIDLLLGTNHLWSDGEITVEYGVHPYYNPTQFESKPLLVVTGKGVLQIGDYVLTIVGRENQTIYIDCESQEAWEVVGAGRISRNDYIQNAGEEFPVLVPGINNISVGSGITAVTITPRWWRI
jgi:phage-related protein